MHGNSTTLDLGRCLLCTQPAESTIYDIVNGGIYFVHQFCQEHFSQNLDEAQSRLLPLDNNATCRLHNIIYNYASNQYYIVLSDILASRVAFIESGYIEVSNIVNTILYKDNYIVHKSYLDFARLLGASLSEVQIRLGNNTSKPHGAYLVFEHANTRHNVACKISDAVVISLLSKSNITAFVE